MPVPIYHASTIAELIAERFAEGGDRIGLHAQMPDGQFHAITFRQLQITVDAVTSVLLKLGVQPSDRVAQLSENRFEWVLVDFACHLLQAIHVPLHASLSPEQVGRQIEHSGARVVVISTREQAAKLAKSPALAESLACIGFQPCGDLLPAAWRGALMELCQQTRPGEGHEIIKDYSENIRPHTPATLLYTSGTTGQPKGVLLSQGNLAANAAAVVRGFADEQEEIKLNFLPLSHIFARTCDLYAWLVRGEQLVLASQRENVIAECQRFQPTCINGVPYFYEKVYRALCEQRLDKTPGALCKLLGGRIRTCNSGGAPLAGNVFDFFHAQGVPLLEGYGLSESSPVISESTHERFKKGSVGPLLDNVEVRIADDGEILTRGPHVMLGYWQDDAATAEAVREGWLHTGDLGRLDENGFLYITGRKKELIVLSNGRKVPPTYLESLLVTDPAIQQAMVIGDNQAYLTALLVANRAALPEPLQDVPVGDAQMTAVYRQKVGQCLASLSAHEQIVQFTLLTDPFTVERGELTPKLSMRRAVIAEHYADRISAMYAPHEGGPSP